jgi:UDP-MurNAc hydroxylase
MNKDDVPQSNQTNMPAIKVRYIYSACIKTVTPDVTILHDPWFTDGIYDGSWFHFPQVKNPCQSIGDVDLIYVSHIHPDHYDSQFLKEYFRVYGVKKIVIADHSPNHLAGKMRADGFEPCVLTEPLHIGSTTIRILPCRTGSISDIDSAIIIQYTDRAQRVHCVVNTNDVIFDDSLRCKLKALAGDVDILLCGFTGAGPYPQTYFDLTDPAITVEAEKKKLAFFERYKTLVAAIDARVNIPFAGKYILGGKLAELNACRGVADPVEVLDFDSRAVVLADDDGEIDTISLQGSAVRTQRYSVIDLERRIRELAHCKMDYERLMAEEEVKQLPLKRLIVMAARNAVGKSECDADYFFCFDLPDDLVAVINANRNAASGIVFVARGQTLPTPRSEIRIDPRYLFGLLTHIYHWNNAEVGSQYNTRRYPNQLNRKAQTFLNYLAV